MAMIKSHPIDIEAMASNSDWVKTLSAGQRIRILLDPGVGGKGHVVRSALSTKTTEGSRPRERFTRVLRAE